MNCISRVRSLPGNMSTEELKCYFYLLSRCHSGDKDSVESLVSADALRKTFTMDDEQLEIILDALFDYGIISEEDGVIGVGYYVGKDIVLYTADDSEKEASLFVDILERAERFCKTARQAKSRTLSSDIMEDLQELSKVKMADFNTPQLLVLFKRLSELVTQEEYRNFDKAEGGSMKRLLSNLGAQKTVQIIINYCTNFDKWGGFPNILNMVKNKDAIYSKVKAVEKSFVKTPESF